MSEFAETFQSLHSQFEREREGEERVIDKLKSKRGKCVCDKSRKRERERVREKLKRKRGKSICLIE